ncbi:MAG: hypothetical protein H6568_13480 [Lewinellaceae bacterium]|nr:hypothetical protein [Saprospiraceae bacterium]MCB9313766.1 hypothetical protein [Lewinellaceae bacterium]HRW74961.1 adenylate/guanylate cyclase domain-containing protein [Saprospiraceae bacterium]
MTRTATILLILAAGLLPAVLFGQTDLDRWEQALQQASDRGDLRARDSARLGLSGIHLRRGEIPNALRYALEGRQSLQNKTNTRLAKAFDLQIGKIYLQANLPSAAIPYLLQGLAEGQSGWSEVQAAGIALDLGGAFLASFQPDSALVWLDRALPGLSGDRLDQALQWKTEALERTGRRQEAITLTEDRLRVARESGSSERVAIFTNNLGYLLHRDRQYSQAARQFEAALEPYARLDRDPVRIALMTHLGIARFNLGQTRSSLDILLKAEQLASDRDRPALRNLIAAVYQKAGDQYNALRYAGEAAAVARDVRDARAEGEAYLTTAGIYTELAEYETALGFYQRHLSIRDSLRLEDRLQEQQLKEQELSLERSEKEIRLLLAAQELRDLTIQQLGLEKDKLQLESDKMTLEAARKEDELALLRQQQEIQAGRLANQALEAARAQQELVLAKQRLEAERKDREINDLNQREALQKLEIAAQNAREKDNLQQISLLNQEKQIQELTIQQQAAFRRSALGAGALLLVILGLIAGGYWLTRRKNRLLAAQNLQIRQQNEVIEANRALIAAEKARSDELLLNILPEETAEELKATGKATPRKYDLATVMFTDFSKFTALTEHLDPDLLIDDLNTYFAAFDDIVSRHGLEKIKTIGDAYMCAGGLGQAHGDHVRSTIRAALEMQAFCREQAIIQEQKGAPVFLMRVGIHCGPVVAGVVGSKKFAYDIWGDTVNTASRLESESEPGRINISRAVFDLVQDAFSCQYRGRLPVKNRGEIEMYFVDGSDQPDGSSTFTPS